jgi:hypothetical protein
MDIPSLFTNPSMWWLAIFGLLATIGFFLALAAMIQQRRNRVQLTEFQKRLAHLEVAENRRVIQTLNRPTRARRMSRREPPEADTEPRIVEPSALALRVKAPRISEGGEP